MYILKQMGRTSFNAVLLANLPKTRKEKKRFFKDTTSFLKMFVTGILC